MPPAPRRTVIEDRRGAPYDASRPSGIARHIAWVTET